MQFREANLKGKKIHQFLTYFWIFPLTVSCTSVIHQFILNVMKVWNINCVCLLPALLLQLYIYVVGSLFILLYKH